VLTCAFTLLGSGLGDRAELHNGHLDLLGDFRCVLPFTINNKMHVSSVSNTSTTCAFALGGATQILLVLFLAQLGLYMAT
jgi:hypothetical protein